MIFDLRYTLPTGHGRQPHLKAVSYEAAVAAVLAEYPEATDIRPATIKGRIEVLRTTAHAAHRAYMASNMTDGAAWDEYRRAQDLISVLERR